MKIDNIELLPCEYTALLEAIRRDLRAESLNCIYDINQIQFHRENMRMSIRLLEIINPKRQVAQRFKIEPYHSAAEKVQWDLEYK